MVYCPLILVDMTKVGGLQTLAVRINIANIANHLRCVAYLGFSMLNLGVFY